MSVSGSMPSLRAAIRVNSLKDEPACRPEPPSPVAMFTWELS